MEKKKIASLTGIRFIMIMVIVVSHFEFLETLENFGDFYIKFLKNATFAVDYFFLLSGFGMMLGNLSKIQDENLKLPKFSECICYGINHVKKIYPVYIATILFGLCVRIVSALYKSKFSSTFVFRESIKLLINIPLLQSATGMMGFTHAFNGVTWFLSALFCIYLVSPILMFTLRKISKSYTTDIFLILIDFFAITVFAIFFGNLEKRFQNIHGIEHLSLDILVYGSPYRRVFYVLTGMSLAMIFNRLQRMKKIPSEKFSNFLEIFVSFIALLYFFARKSLPNLNFPYRYLIDVPLCAVFLLIFSFDKGCVSRFLSKEKMQKLGNMTMYIFLIHYPIRIYFNWLVKASFVWTATSSIIFIIFILTSTFLISDFLYKKGRGKISS